MIDPPQILQQSSQLVAAIHLEIPRAMIQPMMGPAMREVMRALDNQDLEPQGPMFTHHMRMHPDRFDFHVCMPVAKRIEPTGRVVSLETPDVKVARTIYHGTYEGLGSAWGEFRKWIKDNGHQAQADLYECYLVGPETSRNPDDWRTELSQPID